MENDRKTNRISNVDQYATGGPFQVMVGSYLGWVYCKHVLIF